ncbi:Nuclease sbcCD subunit D [Slackia heliotrinireducens]|uniref:DNA repair exonuclease n=1 Tax=Slackia heliotrinireducens (strain ATCC 29202 / DSM 20476 / NCTC 11029 / RHS 1) TaxID=471855 RepID=C7N443_SLAHD|nr:DNA repair exonuclease [Slackia heliotrinireducens]ACV23779.1 DNA repair exonuclease [Slackia heliotrinireducens DSM 20476]VEH03429.1 Nuclease sbcCD subunit D [Slackia heliotrinireducens]
MAEKITFIHSGDLHLGAPFRGLRALSDRWADRLVDAIPEAYDRLIETCIRRKVDFLLLAGDEFDTDKPSYAHQLHFIHGLQRLQSAGIPVYIVAGNHDPYANWQQILPSLPDNAQLMPSSEPGFAVFRRDGKPAAIIAARGFTNLSVGESIAEGIGRQEAFEATGVEAPFVVGMLHTGLWMDPYKAPTSEEALLGSGIDYWALGHIHMRYSKPEDHPKLAFCGDIQGRDIHETGDRGCLLVTLEEGMPNQVEFISTASVQWEILEVDISECAGAASIVSACVRAMFDANADAKCEEMVARITLTGTTPLHGYLRKPGALEDLRNDLNASYPTFFCDALLDGTKAPLDKDALRDEGLFPASLLNVSEGMTADSKDILDYLTDEFATRGLSMPRLVAHAYEELIPDAENIALDLLEGEGGAQ